MFEPRFREGLSLRKKINFAGDYSDSDEEAQIGLLEWTKKKKPVSCPFVKKKYGFDITKPTESSIALSLSFFFRQPVIIKYILGALM